MRFAAAFTCLLLCTSALSAQNIQAGPLDRVQNLINSARLTDARTLLTEWEGQFGSPESNATAADRARALLLRGVLTDDAKEAEDMFVGVVLSYPSSPSAPHALLRLGQYLVTSSDHRRATAYLGRLRNDYPGFAERETGLLWLARAQLGAGSAAAACTTAREIANAANENVRTLAALESDRACTSSAAAPPTAPPAAAQPARAYAVQTAAFREARSAETVAAQLRSKGFDARVVIVEGSDLHRVRFGSFASAAEAAVAGERIRNAGFAVMIVSDALREKKP